MPISALIDITLLISIYGIVTFTWFGFITILKSLFTLGLLAFIGTVLFRNIYQHPMNRLLLLGGGMILGPVVFILLLNPLSYIFHGRIFLRSLFFIVLFICFYIDKHKKLSTIKLFFRPISKKLILTLLILNIILIFFLVNQSVIGGDASIYISIASSFVRGNYPTVLPWQPDYWPVYHHGTFIIIGLLQTIMNTEIDRVQPFFAFYILSSIFIFVSGLAFEFRKTNFFLIPSIFGLVLWGFPVIITNLSHNLISPNNISSFFENLLLLFKNWPAFNTLDSISGTGAGAMQGAANTIFIPHSLSIFMLFLYLLIHRNKASLKYFLSLMLLTIVNLSVNESYLPIQLGLILIFFIYDYIHVPLKKVFLQGLILILIFFLGFFIIQNYMRDSILTPSPEAPRTQVLSFNMNTVNRFFYDLYESKIPKLDINGTKWQLVDIRILIIISLILSIVIRNKISFIFSLAAFISIIGAIFVVSPFWEGIPNNLRYMNLSYQLIAFAVGFLFIDLLEYKKIKIIIVLLLVLLIPQTISSYSNMIDIAKRTSFNYYTTEYYPIADEPDLKIIDSFLPAKARLLLISFQPDGEINQQLLSLVFNRYGYLLPMGPIGVKTGNPDRSIEWYDATNYLDPISVKRLKIDYIFLDKTAFNFLSPKKITQLNDPKYFEQIVKTPNGFLLKPTSLFKSLNDTDSLTMRKILNLIENHKTVFLGNIESNLKKPTILSLAKRTHLIVNQFNIGSDYYMYIETFSPVNIVYRNIDQIKNIDYVILPPNTNPSTFLYGGYNKIGETNEAWLWKRIN